MLNHITIHGRLTATPELRHTSSGVAVCVCSVAVERSYTKQGEEKQTDFFSVVFWRGLAEMVSKFFTKGKEILVSGEMQSRKWQDNEGNNHIAWEIMANTVDFCGSKENNSTTRENGLKGDLNANMGNSGTMSHLDVITDNGDLPF